MSETEASVMKLCATAPRSIAVSTVTASSRTGPRYSKHDDFASGLAVGHLRVIRQSVSESRPFDLQISQLMSTRL